MYNLQKVIFLALAVALLATAGCRGTTHAKELISETGTVRYVDLEGGFFGIVGDSGKRYEAIGLGREFQKDGLRVRFVAKERDDLASVRQWGVIIELVKVEKLGPAGEKAKAPEQNPAGKKPGETEKKPQANPGKKSSGTPFYSKAGYVFDTKLVAANTRFGFKLFSELARQDAGRNIFISPQSVAVALAMAYNGASGETRQAMAKTLELQGMSLQEINQGNAALQSTLASLDPKIHLAIANSLWARAGLPFKPDFMARNKEFYGAAVESLDFNNPSAPARINAWAAKNTQGKIKKIVDKIDPQTIMFLINAVYFKGNWAKEFDKKKTTEGLFILPDGSTKKLPMMSQSGEYRYFANGKFQAVSLPYGSGKVSMYIFLPNQDSSLAEFYSSLNAQNWEAWMSQFSEVQGNVVLPRFKLEYERNLNDILKALGMGVAFDPNRADFRNIIDVQENAFINNVKHKTFVEVNEEGTEAAAVTSVEVGLTCVREEFNIVIDRPFFFAIRDNQTGTILFMGSVVDPQE